MADERLAARYRALATEEPSAVLDDAIRAAARRGVSAGPMGSRRSRWTIPVSIAAVLMLSVGVTLRMQQEQPGIETSDAMREAPAKAATELAMRKDVAPEVAPAPTAAPSARTAAPPAPAAAPAPPAKVASKVAPPPAQVASPPVPAAPPAESPRLAEKTATPPPPAPAMASPAPASPAAPATAAPPPPAAFAAPKPVTAEPTARAASPSLMQDSNTARREDSEVKEKRAKAEGAIAVETPERKLEKIVELRREGRHAEADEAITRFRREHPDYRIPDATWERIKPS